MPKPTLQLTPATVRQPSAPDAVRAAIGYDLSSAGAYPLFPVEGGFLGHGRSTGYAVVSENGDVHPLGVKETWASPDAKLYAPAWRGNSPLPTLISPDRRRMLVFEDGSLSELRFADGARRSVGGPVITAGWMDDTKVVSGDGTKLTVLSASDGAVLAERPLVGEPRKLDVAGRPDGLVVVAFGEWGFRKFNAKPTQRSIEVFLFKDGSLEPMGRRTKAAFNLLVPGYVTAEGDREIYLVEIDALSKWTSALKLELA